MEGLARCDAFTGHDEGGNVPCMGEDVRGGTEADRRGPDLHCSITAICSPGKFACPEKPLT